MRRQPVIRPAAVKDITDHHLLIGAHHPRSAEAFLDAIDDLLEMLSEHPDIGRACDGLPPALAGMRQIPVRGFEVFLMFYREQGKYLVLERVLHGARDIPGLFESGF